MYCIIITEVYNFVTNAHNMYGILSGYNTRGDYLNKLKKAKITVLSFVLALIMCIGLFPFAGAAYTERDKIIDIALSEVGYTQKNGYNKYSAEFGNGYTAWCNYFVVWCAKRAGVSAEAITGTPGYDGNCYLYMSALRSQGRFFENDGSYTPKKGDLVFYNSSRSTSGSTHIGFVLSADANTVTTIEGNVTVKGTRGVDKCVRQRYSYAGDMVIIGFGVPAYSGEEVPKAPVKSVSAGKTQAKVERVVPLDADKFETAVTAEERVKLGENFKISETAPHIDFTSIISPVPSRKSAILTECKNEFCIYNKVK